MRGSARGEVAVSLRDFEWDRAIVATLRHTTLPWSDAFASEMSLAATRLSSDPQLGPRDRLSLLAQFAAHQALLKFAGIGDGEVDPREWAVVAKRGIDCRLVRVAARHQDASSAPPALTLAHQFGEAVRAPRLDVMRQSWARPEAVFIDCFRRLRLDAVADLQWLRRTAAGSLLAPGPDSLRALSVDRVGCTYSDPLTLDAILAYSLLGHLPRVVSLRGAGILRYSALDPLRALVPFDNESEAAVAERIADFARAHPSIACIADLESFDAASRRVIQILNRAEGITWIVPGTPATLAETRWFVLSPRLSAARALDERLASLGDRGAAIEALVSGAALDLYLDHEIVSVGSSGGLVVSEPLRSYVAALALLGCAVPRALAAKFLREFLCERELEELVVDGVSFLRDGNYCFVSSAVREEAARHVPAESRPAMCRLAAAVSEQQGDFLRAGTLLMEAGDDGTRAVPLYERVNWSGDAEIIRILQPLPPRILGRSQTLTATLTRALTDAARYRDARDVAAMLDETRRELALARIERRTGDYAPALARLERLPHTCDGDLLRADILSVLRRDDEARQVLEKVDPQTEDESVAAAYARSLAGIDSDDRWMLSPSPLRPYLVARLQTYRALEQNAFVEAQDHIGEALESAPNTAGRIDALLDRVYALFASGEWLDARRAALEALAEVEETQGDRAAGGLLFLLAYLYADDGQWAQCSQRITRLRHFYGATCDERHLAELDLLAAHLHFSRGEFDAARGSVTALLARSNDAPIRAAAHLIAAECDWLEGRPVTLPEEFGGNLELEDRRLVLMGRLKSGAGRPIHGNFACALVAWERDGGSPPHPATGSEKLKLFRSAVGMGRLQNDASLTALASKLAGEMGIAFETPHTAADEELRFLRVAATREFPFAPHDFELSWRFATRNRLGHWNEIGSLPPLESRVLDALVLSPQDHWMVCSERELLYVRGSSRWAAESKEAIASIFRRRAELYRLGRLLDQEQTTEKVPRAAAGSGVIGESPSIRDILSRVSLIARRDVPICILGESGTGKELIARAVHISSPRRHKPFTAINCAALPETLVESELFGHARGAFTGADRDRAGVIESSDGGTLFLDEIGEMPLSAQAKLLRFLQEGEFRRVGDTLNRSADVRLVTATNRKLESAVEEGRFREDLYYRIRGVEVVLPPLRERGNDILLLANHFLARERDKHRSGPARLSPEVESIFLSYAWPGNVRELQNTIRGAHAIAGESRELEVDHLPDRLRRVEAPRGLAGSYQDAVARFRRELIEGALVQTKGNQNQAAAMLKISRQALGYQIRELGILTEKPPRLRSLVTNR